MPQDANGDGVLLQNYYETALVSQRRRMMMMIKWLGCWERDAIAK